MVHIAGATDSHKLQAEILSSRYYDEKKFCKKCHHVGRAFYIDEDKQLSSRKCECLLMIEGEEVLSHNLPKSNIPKKYWQLDFINYRNTGSEEEKELNKRGMSKIYQYRDNLKKNRVDGVGLYIEGPNGVGKTFLATSLGKEAIRKGFSVRFHLLSEIISLTTQSWDDRTITRTLDKIKNCDFLIIDDADKPYYKKDASFKLALFDDLVRYRVQNLLPCIVTANVELKGASETFNEALHSLLAEQSVNVVLVGEDYRKRLHETRSQENSGKI